MNRPWEKHLSVALLLAAAALAIGEFWNAMAGSAMGAVAFFVGMRPLFLRRRVRSRTP